MEAPATAAPLKRLVGPHLQLGGGLLKAADRAREIGATTVQVFSDNPTAWRRRTSLPPELPAFRDRLAEHGITALSVHAPYLVNLCGPDPAFWERSVVTAINELRVGRAYGADFVNFHIGSHRGVGRDEGLRQLARGLRRVFEEAPDDRAAARAGETAAAPLPRLVLENSPGSGDGIGATIEDLADIVDVTAAEGAPAERLFFCLDTAHLWSAGYPLDEPGGIDRLVGRVDELLGRERVVMIHLNDAQTVRGSRVDRHQHIGAGRIGQPALRELLSQPWLATLPTYLETPAMDRGYDAINLARVRQLLAGEDLVELPADAFEPRGSRSRNAAPGD
ncbi:MAG: deoxyribonuclease IV [Chloroflexota bacterium]|nr:deoxyribonuclease IV [Chloroflexota bacterium]